MRRAIRGAAIAVLLCLSACAQQQALPYDRTASPNNKTIGLISPGWPSGPSSVLASNVGQSFGLVGALINAGMQSAREKELTTLLDTQKKDGNAIFLSDLTADLEKDGYKVVPVSVPTAARDRTDYLKVYPPASDSNVDSYLDIAVFNYGYIAAGLGSSNPYRPWFTARVKLVRASDHAVLMQDIVGYNPIFSKDLVTVSPAPEYAFEKWDDVKNDPQKAAEGVAAALDASAVSISNLLK
jgi:hypothetical protein